MHMAIGLQLEGAHLDIESQRPVRHIGRWCCDDIGRMQPRTQITRQRACDLLAQTSPPLRILIEMQPMIVAAPDDMRTIEIGRQKHAYDHGQPVLRHLPLPTHGIEHIVLRGGAAAATGRYQYHPCQSNARHESHDLLS